MADQIPAQPEQPGQVPPDKAEPRLKTASRLRNRSGRMSPEKLASNPPGEDSDEAIAGFIRRTAGPSRPAAAEVTPQEPEGTPESQENFPCPFDEDIGYEIVEPPEGEESDDGFASIPPGPTEEVNFEPPRVRGPRRRRDRGRREPARAGAPAPGQRTGTDGQAFPDLAGRRRGSAAGGDHYCGP